MSRPDFGFASINHGLESWNSEIDDNFQQLSDFFLAEPVPFTELTPPLDETDLATTFPPGLYDRCVVWVEHSSLGWTLYGSDGTTWNIISTPAAVTVRSNYVLVESAGDFPAPAAGVITLAAGVTYEINGSVDIGTDRINMGSATCIRGTCRSSDQLITSNVGALLTSATDVQLNDLTLTNDAGTLFDFNATSTQHCDFRNLFLTGSDGLGTIQDYSVLDWRRIRITNCDDGLTFDGSNDYFTMVGVSSESNNGTYTFITIPATCSFISCAWHILGIDSGVGQTALDIDSGATLTGKGRVETSTFSGSGTALTGITKAEEQWIFTNNSGISDSRSIGEVVVAANASETTINTIDVFESINATFADGLLERFSRSTDTLTYEDVEDLEVHISATVNIVGVGSGDKTAVVRILVNGSPVGVHGLAFVDNVRNNNAIPRASVVLSNGDTITLEIANRTNTNNLIVEDMLLHVSR